MRERTTIGFLIKQIDNIYEKDFNRLLKSIGITASQCAVLDYLFSTSKEEITQHDIERNLDAKGFILSVPSTTDRRCRNIYLTEKAYDIQKRMEAIRKKSDRQLTLGMNKKEVQALKKMLERVLYNISEP